MAINHQHIQKALKGKKGSHFPASDDHIPANIRGVFNKPQTDPDLPFDTVDKIEYWMAKGADETLGVTANVVDPQRLVMSNPAGLLAVMGLPWLSKKLLSLTNWVGEKTGYKPASDFATKAETGYKALAEGELQSTLGNTKVGAAVGSGFTKASEVTASGLSKVGLAKAANAVQEMPQVIAKQGTMQGLMHGSWVAGSALQMAATGTGSLRDWNRLKKMAVEMTGRNVSTFDILTGNVPEAIKAERNALMTNFLVSEASGGVSLGFAVRSVLKGFSTPIFAATMGASILGSILFGKESSLPAYSTLNKLHKSGEKITGEQYAALIGIASSELKKSGGVESPFTTAVAEQYAQEQLSPAQVMKEIENGGVMKRINAIIAANEVAKLAEPAQAMAEVPQKSHVAALHGRHGSPEHQPIVGEHTAQLAKQQNTMGAAPQLT